MYVKNYKTCVRKNERIRFGKLLRFLHTWWGTKGLLLACSLCCWFCWCCSWCCGRSLGWDLGWGIPCRRSSCWSNCARWCSIWTGACWGCCGMTWNIGRGMICGTIPGTTGMTPTGCTSGWKPVIYNIKLRILFYRNMNCMNFQHRWMSLHKYFLFHNKKFF